MSSRPSGIDPHELRRGIALAAHDFGEWEQPSGAKRDLMVGEIVDLLVALGAALVVLDKDLGAVDGIIKRMQTLYKWVRSRSKPAGGGQEVSAAPATTERERLLVLLFDDYLKTRQPVEGARLAALSGTSLASCGNHLSELAKLGLVHKLDDGRWLFKSR